MRTRRTATEISTAGIDPHNLVATTFLRHYEETEIPEGFLETLNRSITHRTLILNAPGNTLIPSHEIETQLRHHHYDSLDPEFLAHIIHTTLGWQHSATVLDATTRTNITPDTTGWLDKRIAERLPPGTTYVAYKHKIHRFKYSGFFITPDTNLRGQPTLLTLHVGKYPISFSIPLECPAEEAITKLLTPYRNTWPHQNTRDKTTITSIIGIIKTLTGAPNMLHEINGLDIRTRAENINNLITHVLESHETLHRRLQELRHQARTKRPVLTPTPLLVKALNNPDDPTELTTGHLIAAIHALNNGGQVIITEQPLSEVPGQLTTMHTLPLELATQASAPATYLCANITRGNILNGVIIRPDEDNHGNPQLVLTFHSMGFPSIVLPLGVLVWEAINHAEQQLAIQNTQGLPESTKELQRYIIAILTALYRIWKPDARLPHSSSHSNEVTYSTA